MADEVDFWGFVQHAQDELHYVHGYDARATEVLLMLNRASGIVTYDLEASVHRPRGRSWASFRMLYVLWLAGPMESRRLAELTGQSRAATSNLTGPLVTEGLVQRGTDPDDGRSVVLSLTRAGRLEIESLFAEHHTREQEWVGILDDDERRQLVHLLAKLVGDREFAVRRR